MPNSTVCLTVDFDAMSVWFSYAHVTPAMLYRGEYGARVGVPRLLDFLREVGIAATFFVPGHTVESFPAAVEAIVAAGHEVAHHSYAHIDPSRQTPDQERADFERALAALARVGVVPQGYAGQNDQLGLARTLSAVGRVWHLQGTYARAADNQAGIAEALHSLGNVALRQNEYALAREQFEQALAIYRSLSDTQGIAGCLSSLGTLAYNQGDNATAQERFAASLALRRAAGHREAMSDLLLSLGNVAANLSDYAAVRERYAESLVLAREVGRTYDIAKVLNNLGSLASDEGDFITAQAMLTEALALRRTINDQHGLVSTLNNLGGLMVQLPDYAASRGYYAESTTIAHTIGDKEGVAYNLAGLALLAQTQGNAPRAARLAAATVALLVAIDGALATDMQRVFDRTVAQARGALSEPAFQARGMRVGSSASRRRCAMRSRCDAARLNTGNAAIVAWARRESIGCRCGHPSPPWKSMAPQGRDAPRRVSTHRKPMPMHRIPTKRARRKPMPTHRAPMNRCIANRCPIHRTSMNRMHRKPMPMHRAPMPWPALQTDAPCITFRCAVARCFAPIDAVCTDGGTLLRRSVVALIA